jgi:DNA-binding response OmpR family regulator
VGEAAGMKPVIFVVEDDADVARLVGHHLELAGYTPRVFSRAGDVIRQAEEARPSMFLLDIFLPDYSGLELCRQILNTPVIRKTPVVFLTAKGSETDRIQGLEVGADDYITKPFSPRELVARVKAVLRRSEQVPAPALIRTGGIEIDGWAMSITVRGKPVPSTATECRLLTCLAQHAGRVFSRDQLLDAIWGESRFVTLRSVDVYIRRLREKIEVDPKDPKYLRTVRGFGYRFDLDPSQAPPEATQNTASRV